MRMCSKLTLLAMGVAFAALAFEAAEKPDGAALYKQRCSMCHGVDGKGFSVLKTPDFTQGKWQASTTDKAMASVIRLGKKGTPMLAFGDKLKDDEIQAVMAYIRSLGPKKK